jgi:hypothetical protein
VQIDVSGETSDHLAQTLTTKPAGKHKHGGVASRENPWEIGGDISQRFNPANLGETDEVDDHDHEIDIPETRIQRQNRQPRRGYIVQRG